MTNETCLLAVDLTARYSLDLVNPEIRVHTNDGGRTGTLFCGTGACAYSQQANQYCVLLNGHTHDLPGYTRDFWGEWESILLLRRI
jgi:hypothetical protein